MLYKKCSFVWFLVSCSHGKSQTYYLEAVRKGGLKATQCESWTKYKSGECIGNQKALLGIDQSTETKGNYYFEILI